MSKTGRELYDQLNSLLTEQRNNNTKYIDLADSIEIVTLINQEDRNVADAVKNKLQVIAEVVELTAQKLSEGGRLLYFGAGTSGRLGILDAAECPPTFGIDPSRVQGFIAGGKQAVFKSKEGAEDHESNGEVAVNDANVSDNDIVVGLAASGRTPYVVGAIKEAKKRGAITCLVTTVSRDQLEFESDFIIDVPVGPEVIMGSTRMKSATAQKMILNMISTGAMIRLGKIYENVMVDLQLSNNKLRERAKRIVCYFTGCNYEEAESILDEADNHVKTALVMKLLNVKKNKASLLLSKHDGFVRKVIDEEKN